MERFGAILDAAGVADYATSYDGNGNIQALSEYIHSVSYVIYNGAAYYKFVLTDASYAESISFTLNGESYQAEEGMTLCQWAESEYDVNDEYYDAGDGTVRVDETLRYKEDVVIVDGGEYWMAG